MPATHQFSDITYLAGQEATELEVIILSLKKNLLSVVYLQSRELVVGEGEEETRGECEHEEQERQLSREQDKT